MTDTPGEPDPPPPQPNPPQPVQPVLDYHTPGRDAQGWVLVWTARNAPEANLAVATLVARGLRARVDAENTGTLGAWAGAGGGTSTNVQAFGEDAEAARAILVEIDHRRAARQAAREVRCPRCAASGAKSVMKPERWAAIAMLVASCFLAGTQVYVCFPLVLVGIALLVWPTQPKWRCRSCGWRWRAPEPEEMNDDDEDERAEGEGAPPAP